MGIHAMYDSWRKRPCTTHHTPVWTVTFIDDEGKPERYVYTREKDALYGRIQLIKDGFREVRMERKDP